MFHRLKGKNLLYSILKIPAQLALPFYCKKLYVNHPELLKHNGPLLIAANHPNSFLDAILLATLFKKPVHSLVRGDVYTNRFYSYLLGQLNMLPVYRISEGAENLNSNYDTFKKCIEVFKQNGIVLIFSEGRCINEWRLRPLKKGTARLAISAWKENIPLQILPTGVNFSSFRSFGKVIHLNFGKPFGQEAIAQEKEGKAISLFNHLLNAALIQNVYRAQDQFSVKKYFNFNPGTASKAFALLPALLGWIVIAPLYYPLRFITQHKWNNDHFDSIMVAGLFIGFPIYILLLTILLLFIFPFWWVLLFPLITLAGVKCLLLFTK